jgi:argininosuccinate synthase
VALDGKELGLVELIDELNRMAGRHGVGRIDMLENRLIGIKSREVYEAPAAMTLIEAHRELERATLPRETAHFKPNLEQEYARLAYFGLWYSPLRKALDAFIGETQKTVTGTVRLQLFKGSAKVVGRKSPVSLYDYGLATYDTADVFDHGSAVGFISVWGLPTRVYARVNGAAAGKKETAPPARDSVVAGSELP